MKGSSALSKATIHIKGQTPDQSGPEGKTMMPPGYGIDAVDSGLIRSEPVTVQRAAKTGKPQSDVPPVVHEALRSGSHQPLEPSVRATMEARFGEDFSGVRVHNSGLAAESAQAIDARAYTVGNNIVFNTGQYAPSTPEGQHIISHELAHVVQQSQAHTPAEASSISKPGDPGEREAERAASHTSDDPVQIRQAVPTGQVQRFGLGDVKEAWNKHIKPRFKSDEETEGEAKKPPQEETWKADHEEVIRHTGQVFDAGLMVLEKVRADLIRNGDPSGDLKLVDARIAALKQSQSLFQTGTKTFEKGVKAVELAQDVSEFLSAVEELNNIGDLRATDESRMQAAKAFDRIFASAGKLFNRLPDGPWKAYFEFLTHFKDNGGFFSNMTRALGTNARRADRALEGKSLSEPEPAPQAAAPVRALEEVGPDVEHKFAELFPGEQFGGTIYQMERFRAAYEQILIAKEKSKESIADKIRYAIISKPAWRQEEDARIAEEQKAAVKEALDALEKLNTDMMRQSGLTINLDADIAVLKAYE